jgi:hypothetical protein
LRDSRVFLFAEKRMNGLVLKYHIPPGKYLISASFEGLLSLRQHGFFICRCQGAPNGETYVAVDETELRAMWQALQAVDGDRLWSHPGPKGVWAVPSWEAQHHNRARAGKVQVGGGFVVGEGGGNIDRPGVPDEPYPFSAHLIGYFNQFNQVLGQSRVYLGLGYSSFDSHHYS